MTEKRDDLYLPSREFVEQAHIQSRAEYERMWKQSIEDPDTFWGYIAKDFHWFKPWTQVYRGEPEIGDNEWFVGGKTNICYNCLDAQIEKGRGDKVALLFQGEPEADCKRFTYNELLKHVCRFANALKKNGVKKGDRIVLYLPMIWQLPVVMLACARIGAVHTVVFGGFSAEALADRMLACGAKKMVTTNGYWRSGQKINAKANADKACMLCANAGLTIDDVFVVDRMVDFEVPYITYRDTALSKELMLDEISDYCPAEKMDAEDPLFIMYTSGSTGSPKGTLHTTAGYMVYTYTTFKYIFDYKEDDIFFCTADIGWITGHSYIVYGPLLNGATTVMYESVPTYPEPDRFWHIIDKFKVTIFYTAPTVIRALMNQDIQWIEKHDLSTLRLLGSVGEPINPEAWHWYSHYVGHDRCPIVDTWWQTEAGGVLISTIPGAFGSKPGSAALPFFGVKPVVLRSRTSGDEPAVEADVNEKGELCLASAWPGIMRTLYGEPERHQTGYYTQQPGYFFTGDGAYKDEDGYFWITGRIDDVVNISGHRLGTVEIEDALLSHPAIVEAAVVGYPHKVKGEDLYAFVILDKNSKESEEDIRKELKAVVRSDIGPIAVPGKIQFVREMPKNRSGKVVRRILRKIASNEIDEIGDSMINILAEPGVVDEIAQNRIGDK